MKVKKTPHDYKMKQGILKEFNNEKDLGILFQDTQKSMDYTVLRNLYQWVTARWNY